MTREEFSACYREAHAALHSCWSKAVTQPNYQKREWQVFDNALNRFAREIATQIGFDRAERLL